MIKDIISSEYFMLALTFGVFYAAKTLQRRLGWVLFNPILIAIAIIIVFLLAMDIPYETYHEGAKLIEFWLKPAVVALGVPLYLQLSSIKRQFLPILASQTMGCVAGIVSVVVIAKMLGASNAVIMSLASKSVTTPIAMEVTQALGGIPSLTAAIVVNWAYRRHHRFQDAVRGPCPQSHGSRFVNGSSLARTRHLRCHGPRPVHGSICQLGAHPQWHPHRYAHANGHRHHQHLLTANAHRRVFR